MNVINLSIGEPEIEPSRDVVALALDGAAAAGVVPVVAAGNDFEEFGARLGQLSRQRGGRDHGRGRLDRSRRRAERRRRLLLGGPDADLAAPQARRGRARAPRCSRPSRGGLGDPLAARAWRRRTSPAEPRCSASAIPTWTVDQIKAALVETADDVWLDDAHTLPSAARPESGGGHHRPRSRRPAARVRSARARSRSGSSAPAATARHVTLTDAGGGAGSWNVSLQAEAADGVALPHRRRSTSRERSTLTGDRAPDADEGRRAPASSCCSEDAETRRIPFWLRVTRPRLAREPADRLAQGGPAQGNTRGRTASSPATAIPSGPPVAGVASRSPGRSRSSASSLDRPVAELRRGRRVAGPGVKVEPRIVAAGDENRLTGYPGAADRSQPLPRRSATTRFSPPEPCDRSRERTTSSSTAGRRRARRVHVPVLDQRRDSADGRRSTRRPVHKGRPLIVRVSRPRFGRRHGNRSRARSTASGGASRPSGRLRVDTGGLAARASRRSVAGLGLPGDAEHGERRRGPSEHRTSDRDVHGRALVRASRACPTRAPRSSAAGRGRAGHWPRTPRPRSERREASTYGAPVHGVGAHPRRPLCSRAATRQPLRQPPRRRAARSTARSRSDCRPAE